MDVCLKNVDENAWREFKAEAAREGLKVGDYFSRLIKEGKSVEIRNRDKILYGSKPLAGVLSRKEYKKIRGEFRKGFQLRI